MKRKVELLCILILVCMFNKSIAYAEMQWYNQEDIEEICTLYNRNKIYLDILKKKESFSYRVIADYYEKNKFMNYVTNISAYILGENISEDKYIEMLSEIMMFNEYTISEQITKYGSYNTTKDFADFINDATDLVFSVEDIGDFFNLDDKRSEIIYNVLSNGKKIVSKGKEFDELTEDGKKYYQALFENYAFSIKFLSAIVDNTDNKKLKKAAEKLISANDSMFLKQYYYIDKMGTDIIEFSADLFFDEAVVPAAEFLGSYSSDADLKNVTKWVSRIGKSVKQFDSIFNLIIFIGNYSFGTSDTFAYLQRIKAIDEIASCITCEIDKVDVDSYSNSVGKYKAIFDKCSLYRWLITVNGRGESYAKTMLTNANNGLTDIDDLMKMFQGKLTITEKYDLQLESLVRFDRVYLQPITAIDVFESKKGVEREDRNIGELLSKEKEFLNGEENDFEYALCDMDQDGIDEIFIRMWHQTDEEPYVYLIYIAMYDKEQKIYTTSHHRKMEMSLDSEKLRFNPVENVLLEKNGDRTEKLFLQDGVLLSEETDESMYDIAYELEFVPYNYSPESSSSASQVLREFYKSSDWYQEVSATDNSMYELVDIDQDGMPELVIRTGDSQQVQYYIYSYEKDTAQVVYSGSFENGFNAVPTLFYSPSRKALSTYGRTSDAHWDMFYELDDNGEISLTPFGAGWFDAKISGFVRHYYITDSVTGEKKEIASADLEDRAKFKSAAETYYSYVSDLEYITFEGAVQEDVAVGDNHQHVIYIWDEENESPKEDIKDDVSMDATEFDTTDNQDSSTSEYIISDSNSRYLTEEDLINLTPQQRSYARNEIYARKGRKFNSIELQEYFATKEWYQPLYEAQYFDENLEQFCNDYEMKNGTFISDFEVKMGKYELDQSGYDIYAVGK